MSSEEGSNVTEPRASAAPQIQTMTMSFTLWTLGGWVSWSSQQQIISYVLKLESLESFELFWFTALFNQPKVL